MADLPDLEQLKSQIGSQCVSTSPDDVARHSYDAWPVAAKWKSQGKTPMRPDAVVRPQRRKDVSKVLKWASEKGVPVTPWGAGSAVTGAPLSAQGGLSLDLSQLIATIEINNTNHTVRVEAGKRGDTLEHELNAKGFTLNHSPQSLGRSTVGGWLATRSSGQFSSRWGSIEDLCQSFTIALPNGDLVPFPSVPRASAGPDLRHLFLGSEGVLGVILDVTLRIFEIPETRVYETLRFDKLEHGLDTLRRIMQSGLRPFLLRLYDSDEAPHAVKDATMTQPLLFIGCEGFKAIADAELKVCQQLGAKVQAERCGGGAVEAWMERRFDFSAVEEILNTPGGFAETIEIASGWDRIHLVYRDMKQALSPLADEVFGHFSHAYTHGTSLYLILLGSCADDDAAEKRLLKIWDIAMRRCLACGAAISHHHGVGYARRKFIQPYWGQAFEILKEIKRAVDPNGIMNPGKFV